MQVQSYTTAMLLAAVGLTTAGGASKAIAAETSEGPTAARQMIVQVVSPEDKPMAGAEVKIRIDRTSTGQTTDEEGIIRVELAAHDPRYLSLAARYPGHVPLQAYWRQEESPDPIPQKFTFRMQRGTTIGGIIRDEQGKPIQDAKVYVLLPSEQWEKSRPRPLIWDHAVQTDASGKWVCDILPADFTDVWLRLEHPDYISDRRYGETPRPAIAELRAGGGVMVMKRGISVAGKVTAPDGTPISGAAVAQGSDRFGSHYPETKTDEQGQYRFGNCPPGPMVLTVVAKGWAPDLRQISVAPGLGPVDFKLSQGKTIRVRVRDQQGKPLSGVWIAPDTWRGHRSLTGLGIPRETDKDGFWQWTWAPQDAVLCDILKQGYMDLRNHSLAPRDEEYAITLQQPLKVSGRVVDAETNEPIKQFRVVTGIDWGSGGRVAWERRETIDARDGQYSVTFTFPRFAHLVRIEADGYLPAVSRAFKDDEGSVTFDFQLKPGSGPQGLVRLPDGKPAQGAEVLLATPSTGLYLNNGVNRRQSDSVWTKTDAEGRFSLPPQTEPCALLILHDTGIAQVKESELSTSAAIELRPWARVEGTLRLGSRPGAGETVALHFQQEHEEDAPRIYFDYKTQTDSEGRFVFERVMPGKGNVYRAIRFAVRDSSYSQTYTHGVAATFMAGETTQVQIGGTGRPVTGRVTVPRDADQKVDWNFGVARIHRKQPAIPWPEELKEADSDAKREWLAKWLESDEGKKYQEQSQARLAMTYSAPIAPDGSFRLEDVPAEEFELQVRLDSPPAGQQCGLGESIGSLRHEFTVPETAGQRSDDPVDLGTLTLTVIRRLKAGDEAPEFEVKTVDEKVLRLSQLRGKYVLLDFWATWCGPCREELPHLKDVWQKFGSREDFAMVGLSADQEIEDLRKYVSENDMTWSQGFLGSDSKVQSDYGVRGIPAVFLVSPDGKIMAKDLRGAALMQELEQHLR